MKTRRVRERERERERAREQEIEREREREGVRKREKVREFEPIVRRVDTTFDNLVGASREISKPEKPIRES